ncbi:three-helix bundle dimerization domain-containing protein [Lacisediminihabitans sp. H27-G8]|uniref:three-helix bundle dimerization domain-containing protein n=1 Tax=Lacisediminihabitans sp. H27-G8 TaxID=3111909 RepID=UPI0038FC9C4B
MDQVQEDQGIAKVIDRLAERFPALDRARVEQVVADTRSLLDGNPIRDYVPVLVERTARDQLRRIAAGDPSLALVR